MKLNKSFLPKYFILPILFISAIIVLVTSCKKEEDDPKKPVITTVGDGSGEAGDTLIIAGENFNDAGEKTTVFFGTANAKILTGTKTTIKVIVPNLLPSTVKVKAEVNELESNAVDFIVEKEKTEPVEPMEFDDFEPKSGKFETEVTISGENFTDNVEVYVNNKRQTPIVVNSEGTKITFQLASQTYSGEVMIKRGAEELTHEELMEYELSCEITDFGKYGGIDLVVLKDKSYFLIRNFELLKIDNNDEVSDTIIKIDGLKNPSGLYYDDKNILYIADNFGKIFYYDEKNDILDSIESDHPELLSSIHDITGDNKGYLYVGSSANFGIIKININSGETKQILNTSDDPVSGVTFYSDTIFASTKKGILKVHISGGSHTYVVSKDEGHSFANSEICRYPSGDYIIVDDSNINGGIYLLNKKNRIIKEFSDKYSGINISNNGAVYILNNGNSFHFRID